MGGREQQPQQQPQPQPQFDGGDRAPSPQTAYEDSKKSLDFVIAFATNGRGKQTDLVKHVARVGAWADQVKTLIPDIAKHAKGEIVLECAALLGQPLGDQVHHALHAKKPIGADALREQLRLLSYDDVANIGAKPGLVAEVRKVLKGPIGKELPELARLENATYQHAELLKWWLETTNATVAAIQLCNWSDPQLTAALDALAATTPEAWGWLDHVHIAPHNLVGFSLETYRDATKNAAAKAKLTTLAAKFKHEMKDREAGKPQAKADLATQLSSTDDTALLDAAARTQGEGNTDSSKLRARLAGESADVVGQYLQTMSFDTKLVDKIELLDQATGVRDEHLRYTLRGASNEEIVALLEDDRARKRVRGIMGKGTGLRDLLSVQHLDEVHAAIVKDEALRQWAYEDKDPRNLLWIAAGSGPGAKDGCRLVKREKGNAWVKQLPRTADELQLRRFVLNTNDAKLATWVKANLVADGAHRVADDDAEVVETSRVVYGQGTKARLDVATSPRHDHPDSDRRPDPDLILARLADMSEAERAAILKSKVELKKLFEDLVGLEQRAVHLLQPTLPQLLAMPITNAPELASYAAGRRQSEQVAAAEQAGDARRLFGELSPFVALPLVRAPSNLAKALEDNEPLLDWILETTEPNQALEILARDPASKVAAGLMEMRSTTYAGLPAFDNLRKRGREGFQTIAKGIKDGDSKAEVTEYVDGDAATDKEVDAKATKFNQASKKKLWHGIDALYEAGGSRADLISLVQASEPSEQVELLRGGHASTVRHLQQRVRLGPQHVFIDLDVQQMLKLPSAAEWLLAAQDSYHVLGLIGSPESAKALGHALSYNAKLAESFILGLPRGQALTAAELHTIDQIARHVMEPGTLRRLFGARFDTIVAATYDLGETKRLWSVLERLPPAQVNQKVIKAFTEQDLKGPVGQWDPNNRTVDLEQNPKKLEGNDTHFGRGILLTAEEVKGYYGLDDAGLAKAAAPKGGWLTFENGKYRVSPINPKQFQVTVLHEVGHSIDELLGSATDLVYEHAGWKRYGYDQFETWATEMGALEHVATGDRTKFVEAWQQSMRSKTAVSKLVGADHPAMQDKKSPLARWVNDDRPFSHNDATLKPVNDRVFLQTPTSLASVKKQTWDNAPTQYAMTAPAEFFAECYAEYYCGYDGTAATEAKKGGRLANWIKKWFDEHVDKIRLNPQRVQGDQADNTPP